MGFHFDGDGNGNGDDDDAAKKLKEKNLAELGDL